MLDAGFPGRSDHRAIARLELLRSVRDPLPLLDVEKVKGYHVETARGERRRKGNHEAALLPRPGAVREDERCADRAHRIGQTRVVTSYKLIARDTVEEKLLHLQTRKRETLQAMLGDEEQLAGSLNWDEIQELLTN